MANDDSGASFKDCTNCGHPWPERDGFLADPQVELKGYQAWLPDPVLGLFLFNHNVCGTTLGIPAREFEDLYDGPVYKARKTGTEDCYGYCESSENSLDPCPAECECAWVREILQIVRNWPKEPAAGAPT
jgi:hypothetical protein